MVEIIQVLVYGSGEYWAGCNGVFEHGHGLSGNEME
jgi:hypothetical protein